MAHRDRSNHSNNNNNGQYSKISYKLLHDQNESNQPSDNKLGSECAVLLSHSSNEDDETIMKSSYNIDTRLFDMKHVSTKLFIHFFFFFHSFFCPNTIVSFLCFPLVCMHRPNNLILCVSVCARACFSLS